MSELLAADPGLAQAQNTSRAIPLDLALLHRRIQAARCMLSEAPLPPTSWLLANLPLAGRAGLPLYGVVVARRGLAPKEWALVPPRCPGLGAGLPAALERSVEEAKQVVRRLPAADLQRLQWAALVLARLQRVHDIWLPTHLVWRLLALTAR